MKTVQNFVKQSYNFISQKISHFLAKHFPNGEKTSVTVKKHHAIVICSVTLLISLGSLFCIQSYYKAKVNLITSSHKLLEAERDKEILAEKATRLEQENEEYKESISEIQNKATEIENKISELEHIKKELHQQLDTLSEANTSAVCNTMVASIQNPSENTPTFTTLVQTAYSRVSSLSTGLDRLDKQVSDMEIEFIDVADDVTQTLSAISSAPSGYPVSGRLTTSFNPTGDSSISDGRVHKGIDLATSYNTPVHATASGVVTEAEFSPSYGYYVKISHNNGYETLYAHNASLGCAVGDSVKKGDVIAYAGSTGYSSGVHVHYEILLNGSYQNPVDYR
ncbi:MAG: peptidoglycan DD-metalloendopeptidase family protein [Epulopiscium sp.]|nr:peptidoglycan DD-metalloendopeptidase family protein [Candidatus Epulonipiscium sp.]